MKFERDAVIKALEEKQANRVCHRCGNQQFTIIDGFSKMFIQQDSENIGGLSLGGPVVPVVLVACSKCGAITMHAAIALGLMPPEVKNDSPKQ